MENFKFGIISVLALAGVGVLGYWAFMTLEPGDLHALRQEIRDLREENKDLQKEIARLESELGTAQAEKNKLAASATPQPTITAESGTPPEAVAYKHQSLINELQKLINDKVYMKEGSKGTRVGTVQKFLNLYNNTSNKVDNDYGPSMKTAVTAFQKAVGITADGETGPATYQKMIDWLKKQG